MRRFQNEILLKERVSLCKPIMKNRKEGKMPKKRKFILADWKNPQLVINLLIEEIELRGGKVYACPDLKGSDMYGYVVSDEPLTGTEMCYFEREEDES